LVAPCGLVDHAHLGGMRSAFLVDHHLEADRAVHQNLCNVNSAAKKALSWFELLLVAKEVTLEMLVTPDESPVTSP